MESPRQIGWAVGPDGAVTKYEPPKPFKPLTAGQRHAGYRRGLQMLQQAFESHGFVCNCIEQSTMSLSFDKKGFFFDFKLTRPANIAYVTSYPGYKYDEKKINAKVTTLASELDSEWIVQVIVSGSRGTKRPVFIGLPINLTNPAQFVAENVLMALHSMSEEDSALKDAILSDSQQVAVDIAQLMNGQTSLT